MLTTLSEEDVLTLAPSIRLRRDHVRDRWVVLAPERAVVLNEMGAAVILAFAPRRSLRELIDELTAPLDPATAERARADVLAFVLDLAHRGLVQRA